MTKDSSLVPPEFLTSATPVAFFGYARPKPGCRGALVERMRALGEPSRAEAGVIVYEIHDSPSETDAVAFYEYYADGAALRSHMEMPYMQAFFADRMTLLESDLDIVPLMPIVTSAPVAGATGASA